MKNTIFICILSIILFSCKKKEENKCFENDPFEVDWLLEAKNKLISDTFFYEKHQSITMYKYKNKYVFEINACPQCPDYGTTIVDCNQNTICFFGGIAGQNTCPDFYDSYSEREEIYSE